MDKEKRHTTVYLTRHLMDLTEKAARLANIDLSVYGARNRLFEYALNDLIARLSQKEGDHARPANPTD